MKNKILILGASGRLGGSLYEFYNNKNTNFEVIKFDRKNKVNENITDRDVLNNYLNNIKPDIIINSIALADVESCETNPLLALKLNSEFLNNIVEWMNENKNAYMIHISTDHVYDNTQLSSENDVNIKNMYAYSKYIGDIFAQKSNSSILRTNFFGIFSNKDSLCNWVLNSIKNNKKIYCYDNIFFSPLHISTLVRFVDFFVNNKISGIYNIGSLNGFSKHNFILEMIKTLGLKTSLLIKSSYTSDNNKIDRPKNMMMNLNKISKIYNKDMPILTDEINKLRTYEI